MKLARFKQELATWRLALMDPETPRAAKWLLGLAIAYAVSPIDLIPDFIPVLGHLDDAILIPLLIWLACRLIPKHVIQRCRRNAAGKAQP
ncbi:DUF1232 domain-containing protein [Candidatus Sumerlaeota bacterium]|nr:DUF1232 domain-containing protein [Candidatus Sumerlaeota bacterium]